MEMLGHGTHQFPQVGKLTITHTGGLPPVEIMIGPSTTIRVDRRGEGTQVGWAKVWDGQPSRSYTMSESSDGQLSWRPTEPADSTTRAPDEVRIDDPNARLTITWTNRP